MANQKRSGANSAASYHHGDLRAALIEEARSIIERDGPDDVSLRAVALATGVSRAAPYHHFKDKQALLAAVAAAGFRALASHMREQVDERAAPRARLDQIGFGYVEYGVQNPELFRLMQGPVFQQPGLYPDLDEARALSAAPLIETVAACLPDTDEANIRNACAAAWSIVHGMTVLCTDGRMKAIIDTRNLRDAVGVVTAQLQLSSAAD